MKLRWLFLLILAAAGKHISVLCYWMQIDRWDLVWADLEWLGGVIFTVETLLFCILYGAPRFQEWHDNRILADIRAHGIIRRKAPQ